MQDEESPKKTAPENNLLNDIKKELTSTSLGSRLKKWKNAIIEFITSLKKIRDITKNNYELGRHHYDLGNFGDAVMRFKLVTWLEPKHADGWYWLASSYIALEKKQQAIVALKKAIELKPNWQEARDMLKAASSAD